MNLDPEIIVVALGGNAIMGKSRTFTSQYEVVSKVTEKLALLIKEGYTLVITHGNGPQVGDTLLRHEAASNIVPALPLFACVAETQGLIGFMIQHSLSKHLSSLGMEPRVASIITRVKVSDKDPALKEYTKPVGPLYSKEELKRFNGTFKEIDGMYRRVVPSPDPIEVLEASAIKYLACKGYTVIAVGGGGIPVLEDGFLDAVIDKDLASERLATAINASKFVILTAAEGVYLNYRSKERKLLRKIRVKELKALLDSNEFEKGSMEPKVLAVIRFVENTGKEAIIASLDDVLNAVRGYSGTVIHL